MLSASVLTVVALCSIWGTVNIPTAHTQMTTVPATAISGSNVLGTVLPSRSGRSAHTATEHLAVPKAAAHRPAVPSVGAAATDVQDAVPRNSMALLRYAVCAVGMFVFAVAGLQRCVLCALSVTDILCERAFGSCFWGGGRGSKTTGVCAHSTVRECGDHRSTPEAPPGCLPTHSGHGDSSDTPSLIFRKLQRRVFSPCNGKPCRMRPTPLGWLKGFLEVQPDDIISQWLVQRQQ